MSCFSLFHLICVCSWKCVVIRRMCSNFCFQLNSLHQNMRMEYEVWCMNKFGFYSLLSLLLLLFLYLWISLCYFLHVNRVVLSITSFSSPSPSSFCFFFSCFFIHHQISQRNIAANCVWFHLFRRIAASISVCVFQNQKLRNNEKENAWLIQHVIYGRFKSICRRFQQWFD